MMRLFTHILNIIIGFNMWNLNEFAMANDSAISPIPLAVKVDVQKVKLGRRLFHDTRLSQDNSISCASCHLLSNFGIDGTSVSTGVGGSFGSRNSPSVYNVMFNESYFWDGRADDLEEQIEGPIHNPVEMNSNWKDIIKKLEKDKYYVKAFKTTFEDKKITAGNIRAAIAEYEKNLITPNSAFDKYLRGDKTALNKRELKGYKLFKNYGCISCHQGTNVGGNMLQLFGVTESLPAETFGKDGGRITFSKDINDRDVYRVPSLRNVEKTHPYFHDGSVKDLKEAIRIMGKYQLGLNLKDSEIELIYEFLLTLTGEPQGF